ncbi:DUF1659 domain-containing protein [Cytobacillus kochii]|uniref:DUF1659 domain-containing protein n=1 Tax=Cytobacillus kochii TaxID=859143 RepID=UPI00402AFB89
MAQTILVDSKLRLSFETGVNEKGEAEYKVKTFSHVKSETTADQLYRFAEAYGSLAQSPLVSIQRNDNHDILQ